MSGVQIPLGPLQYSTFYGSTRKEWIELKLTKDEFQRIKEQHPLELFRQGIRSRETLEKYERTLKWLLTNFLEDILEGSFEERVSQLVKNGRERPDWVRDLLLNISKKLRERTRLPKNDDDYLSPNSFDNYFKPLKKLFDMNDIVLSWKRVYATFPEIGNNTDGRGWTRDEIQKMLKFANDPMDRTLVLIAASSGIRVGGFNLDWEDVKPIYLLDEKLTMDLLESEVGKARLVCAALKIYKGSKEEYGAFITPEAYETLQDHRKEWIREVRREPKPTDPIFKLEGSLLKRASISSIKKRIERMVEKAELRVQLQNGKRRHDVPIMNGFRRFWNKVSKETLSKDSPLASLIKKEFMMGHVGLTKLDRNYFKTHIFDFVEEYLALVPDLTISNENRLRVENSRLRKDNDTIKDVKAEMEKWKKTWQNLNDIVYIEHGNDLEKKKKILEKIYKRNNLDPRLPIKWEIKFDEKKFVEFHEELKIQEEWSKEEETD